VVEQPGRVRMEESRPLREEREEQPVEVEGRG
jgi:hypothetical protein